MSKYLLLFYLVLCHSLFLLINGANVWDGDECHLILVSADSNLLSDLSSRGTLLHPFMLNTGGHSDTMSPLRAFASWLANYPQWLALQYDKQGKGYFFPLLLMSFVHFLNKYWLTLTICPFNEGGNSWMYRRQYNIVSDVFLITRSCLGQFLMTGSPV